MSKDRDVEVAFITIKRKGSRGFQASGNWIDGEGKSFDLGYVVMPTGRGIRSAVETIVTQLEQTLNGKGVLTDKKGKNA